jgi:hypothetical protein
LKLSIQRKNLLVKKFFDSYANLMGSNDIGWLRMHLHTFYTHEQCDNIE